MLVFYYRDTDTSENQISMASRRILHTERVHQPNRFPLVNRLGHDILCIIFSLNCYMDDNTSSLEYFDSDDWSFQHDASLLHIRWLSHVCRLWRELTLQSPILWARSLNLWNLDQRCNRWRDEVMKRTGDVPLAIRGVITMAAKPSTELLLSVLETQWTRLRVLNIAIRDTRVAEDHRWQALYRPAPNLEVFRLKFPTTVASISSQPGGLLFSGHAPYLYHFCYSHPLFKPPPTILWTSQISTMTIYHIRSTTFEILDMVSLLPHIEVLNIYARDMIDARSRSNYPHLSLSRLRLLQLRCNTQHAASFMRHITLPLGCRVILKTTIPYGQVVGNEEALSLQSSVSHYFSNSIGSHSVERLYWKFTGDEWDLSGDDFKESDLHKKNHSMIFQFYISGNASDTNAPFSVVLLSAFAECDFTKITSLEMEISSQIDPRDPALHSFLHAFSSVDTIYTQSYTLAWLNDVLIFAPSIFPRLQTLVFADGLELALDPAAIMRFLFRRQKSNMPIQTFDLQKCRSRQQELLLFLEGIDDLNVLWDPIIRSHYAFTNRGWTGIDADSE